VIVRDTLGIFDICFLSSDQALLRAAEAENFQVMDPLTI
jgi:hypothetical protein